MANPNDAVTQDAVPSEIPEDIRKRKAALPITPEALAVKTDQPAVPAFDPNGALPTEEEYDFAVRRANVAPKTGPERDYINAILDPHATQAQLDAARELHNSQHPSGPRADQIFGGTAGDPVAAAIDADKAKETSPGTVAGQLGIPKDEFLAGVRRGTIVPGSTPPGTPKATPGAVDLSKVPGGSALRDAGQGASAAHVVAGGFGMPPVPVPIELRAGVQIANILSPPEYASQLRSKLGRGEITPAEAAKQSQEYRAWYNSTAGKTLRLEGMGVQDQTLQEQAAIDKQTADANTADRLTALSEDAERRGIEMDRARQEADDQYQRTMAEHAAQYGELMDRIEHTKIEPFSGDGGQSRAAALGVAAIFGGIQQALTGKENVALPLIDKSVDNEIKKQELEANQRVAAAQGKMNLMQMTRAVFSDGDQSRLLAKKAMYEHLANQLKIEVGKADTDQERQGAALAAEMMDRRAQETQLAFEARTSAVADADRLRMLAGAQASISASEQQKKLDDIINSGQAMRAFKDDGTWRPRHSNLYGGYFHDEKARQEADNNMRLRLNVLQDLEKVRAMRAISGSSTDPKLRAAATTIITGILSKVSVMQGQGAQTSDEFDRNLERLGDSKTDILGTGMTKVDQMIDLMKSEVRGLKATASVTPGAPPVTDPSTGETYIPLNVPANSVAKIPGVGGKKEQFLVQVPPGDPAAGAEFVDTVPGPSQAPPEAAPAPQWHRK